LAVVFTVCAMVAGRLDRLSITAPMVLMVAGGFLGPGGTDLLKDSLGKEVTLAMSEITLTLLLFADAATARRHHRTGRRAVMIASRTAEIRWRTT
jgi:Kef-type K+ transport system membrane component KefB